MSRILAFGCSLTYGHGLYDCINYDNTPGPVCSEYAWPSLLGKKLNKKTVNLSNPGSSNKEIWHKVVNTQFENNDVVFILWTYHDRYCVIEDENYVHQIGAWNVNKDKRSKLYFKNMYNELDSNYDMNLRMIHLEYFLKEENIKSYHLVAHKSFKQLNWNKVKLLESSFQIIRKQFPLALDNKHPGDEAHKEFANQIYKEISNENL